MSEAAVKAVWRAADCVCFDVDSTVCMDEAIDELASYLGVGDQVAKRTRQAMSGRLTFKESLTTSLDLIKPSKEDIRRFIANHPPRFTEGVRELVSTLHERNVHVYLVSGGFRSIIGPIADVLGVPRDNVYANTLKFDKNGLYAGFDETEPTCAEGGKPKVIQILKDTFGYRQIVHIGDGATDMEACPPADAFIGFGGNQIRESVRQGSSWYVMSFLDLMLELQTEDCNDENDAG